MILLKLWKAEVYGNQGKDGQDLTEDLPLRPITPYGVSKAMIELYLQERCNNGFLKGFIMRAFSHTGPGRGKNFSISCDAFNLVSMKRDPSSLKELSIGNLKTKRIVIDARDCVRAYYEVMQKFDESVNGQVYNVCGAKEDIKEMEYYTNKLIEISGLVGVTKKINPKFFRPVEIQVQI